MAFKKVRTTIWGGARSGAGRKKVLDKKEAIFIYLRKSVIEKTGKDQLKEKLTQYANQL